MFPFKKNPAVEKTENKLAKFMREGSDEEHQRVFKKVIDAAIKDQQAIIRRAAEMRAEQARNNEKESVENFPKTSSTWRQ
ncbi:MAG: hypothetical protein ACR2P7_09190 [bacterium]